jgi:hypothetical protein
MKPRRGSWMALAGAGCALLGQNAVFICQSAAQELALLQPGSTNSLPPTSGACFVDVKVRFAEVPDFEIQGMDFDAYLAVSTSTNSIERRTASSGSPRPSTAFTTNNYLGLPWQRVLTASRFRSVQKSHRLADSGDLCSSSGRKIEGRVIDVLKEEAESHASATAPAIRIRELDDPARAIRLEIMPTMFTDSKGLRLQASVTLREFAGYDAEPPATGNNTHKPKPVAQYRFHKVRTEAKLWDHQTLALAMPLPESQPPGTNSTAGTAWPKHLLLFLTVELINQDGNPIHTEEERAFADSIPPQPPG